MELKRILAKDSRRAIEEVSEQFGEDALVISSNKVNGQQNSQINKQCNNKLIIPKSIRT